MRIPSRFRWVAQWIKTHQWVGWVLAGLVVAGAGYWTISTVGSTIGIRQAFHALSDALQDLTVALGPWGPLLLILALAAHSVAFVFPMEIPTLAAFSLYGPLNGLAIVWVGSMLAATISYLIGKWLGPPVLKRWEANPRVAQLTRAIGHLNPLALILLRWISFIPFDVLNMMFGAFNVPLGRFLWTTAVGVLATNVVMAFLYHSAVHAHWTELVTGAVLVLGAGWLIWWWNQRSGQSMMSLTPEKDRFTQG
ncbi:hypothetical protein TPY_1108 [Sulfobacillus acidophilus TPY]|uniref:TVP38/TMEM64 family membrane protein n=1 Tax=Sulfobacillus acidophilus (strain ATCC 700253 / DSM 10332 / NAL) TaxID=679936 RepID=G8TWL6_SULAD|nr:hypothetical protein TPY_1108 [Sulfobacillus acidophilus TPY]AEW06005.1 SNARE associated Golgi protein-like protein [Sulfobacillus acidophilus DSM 10332]